MWFENVLRMTLWYSNQAHADCELIVICTKKRGKQKAFKSNDLVDQYSEALTEGENVNRQIYLMRSDLNVSCISLNSTSRCGRPMKEAVAQLPAIGSWL